MRRSLPTGWMLQVAKVELYVFGKLIGVASFYDNITDDRRGEHVGLMIGVCRDGHKPRASGSNRPHVTDGIRHAVEHGLIIEQNVTLVVDTATPLDGICNKDMQLISGNGVVCNGSVGG